MRDGQIERGQVVQDELVAGEQAGHVTQGAQRERFLQALRLVEGGELGGEGGGQPGAPVLLSHLHQRVCKNPLL